MNLILNQKSSQYYYNNNTSNTPEIPMKYNNNYDIEKNYQLKNSLLNQKNYHNEKAKVEVNNNNYNKFYSKSPNIPRKYYDQYQNDVLLNK